MMVDSLVSIKQAIKPRNHEHISRINNTRTDNGALWTYKVASSFPQEFSLKFISDCNQRNIEVTTLEISNNNFYKLFVSEKKIVSSSNQYANGKNADKEFPNRNRLFVSDPVTLHAGLYNIAINCINPRKSFQVTDLSLMNTRQLERELPRHFLFKSDPEVGDAQETYFASKYALNGIYWANPPLLYPIYRSIFEILGTNFRSIQLFELFAFSFVILLLWEAMDRHQKNEPFLSLSIPLLIVINYLIVVTILPFIHTAAGIFLLTFLASSWFIWRRQFILAIASSALMCLLRYEGVVLLLISIFAISLFVIHDYRRDLVWKFVIASFILAGSYIVVTINFGQGLGIDDRFKNNFNLHDLDIGRIFTYGLGGVLITTGAPLLWMLARKTDRITQYYIMIAVMYFGFLCSLSYVRPYHFGPFVIAAAAGGARALVGYNDDKTRRIVIVAFIAISLGWSYWASDFPRSLCGDPEFAECQFIQAGPG